jgi:anti-sigma-K factor RskA
MRTQENNRQACRNTSNVWRLNALAAAMAVAMGGFSAGAFAAAPAANSQIGNTATATYTDASAVPRSSNI